MKLVEKLFREESGVTVIEYAIIAGLLAIAAVVAMTDIGSSINNIFESVNDGFPD